MEVSKENAKTIVNAFNHITCDAFSPGVKDFAAGLDFFKQLREDSNFDYVSCNIKDTNKELLLQPYKIISHEGFSIGVIGASSSFQNNQLYIENPFAAIQNTVKSLEGKCDFIVLLFSCSDSDYIKLNTLSDNLGVDFIVRGNTRRKSTDGGKGRSPIYSTGDRGKVVYQFDLKYKDKDSPLIDIAFYEKSIQGNQKRINKMISNPGSEDKILTYEQNIQLSNSIIEKAQNTLQFKSVTLNKMIDDNPYVLKIVDAGKNKIIDMGGPSILDPHYGHKH
mgnify:CR=1 FL=1